jgi:hypothetical protein
MVKCEKCGSRVFLVDETATHLEINDLNLGNVYDML